MGSPTSFAARSPARVTPKTWWENMENGWVWDLDDFVVNQIGHPYQGSNYYNGGRANGLSFYESAAMAAFGSATWEFYGETNKPSLNDFINTTLGGIAIGEVLHRVSWLMRDTTKSGSGRLWSEIGATVLDPVTGYNRFRGATPRGSRRSRPTWCRPRSADSRLPERCGAAPNTTPSRAPARRFSKRICFMAIL
jgi:hypothetical protein